MEQRTTLRKYLRELFAGRADRRTTDLINIRNIRNVYTFSLIACVVDVLSLTLYSATNWDNPRFRQTVIYVGSCVIACAAAVVLSKRAIGKYERGNPVSNTASNALVMFFYIAMSAWGITVDAAHYETGDQMLTFYIVQFCFLCFVVMPPKAGGVLIVLSFSALYLSLYAADGAARMQPQNYLIFVIIAVFGNAIQHMTLRRSEQSKLDILELNQILRQEASFDDLTKLKNRKALRGDFDKNMGKSVHIIMADIDRFKDYNDTYGHVVGDKVLRRVADVTQETFADGDTYRYGGDELLIILADYTDEKFAEGIGRWEAAIRSIEIPGVSGFVTCSFGYERCLMDSAQTLRAAIKTADDRLYEAKKAKRGDR